MIVTIGHSTLSQDGFLGLLAEDGVRLLWDVRSYPTSHWAWFRREQLERWLPAVGVEYVWAPALGGRRPAPPARSSTGPPPPRAGGGRRASSTTSGT